MFFKKFWTRLRKLALTSGQLGLILNLAFFTFEITQSWVDAGISTPVLRWILPLGLSFSVLAILGSLFLVFNLKTRKEVIPPEEALTIAIIDYARQLHSEGRDQTLVNLRNYFSYTLHVLGFHNIRVQLGEMTLQSATVIRDNATKAEVLVDDLGWANYLLGNEKAAIKNIERGITISGTTKSSETENEVNNCDVTVHRLQSECLLLQTRKRPEQ